MKYVCFFILVFICCDCFGQFSPVELSESMLPKSIKFAGKIVNAVRWQDKAGDNIVITTETAETQSQGENEGRDKALYAYHFLISKDSTWLTWKVNDKVTDCPVDIVAGFAKSAFKITDLDNNGIAEVWLIYNTVCRGDVSPSNMKIIMYEGGKKYAMRGHSRVEYEKGKYIGGEYSIDAAFEKSPKTFLQYAQKMWKKNINESWR